MPLPRWVTIMGDGLAYTGPCLLTDIIVSPDANHDFAIIYDGRDTTSGKRFAQIQSATRTAVHLSFAHGLPFDSGIYIDGNDDEVETTVAFIPLPE